MAFDEHMADRMRSVFAKKGIATEEKRMMGGLAFMVNDKMCSGIFRGGLMARIDPNDVEKLLERKGVIQMELGGRIMKGYLRVDPEGFDREDDLEFWIQQCLDFNPKAKASKKRKK